MPQYNVYGVVTGTKYIGKVKANSKEEAEQLAYKYGNTSVSLCHHCSREIDEPYIEELVIEEVEED